MNHLRRCQPNGSLTSTHVFRLLFLFPPNTFGQLDDVGSVQIRCKREMDPIFLIDPSQCFHAFRVLRNNLLITLCVANMPPA